MEYKYNCDKMHIINRSIIKSKDDFENLNDFIRRWEDKIKEIEKEELENYQCYDTAMMFLTEWEYKFFYEDTIKNKLVLINQLSNDLRLALNRANNNYKKENRNFWNLFFKDKLKLPNLHVHIK